MWNPPPNRESNVIKYVDHRSRYTGERILSVLSRHPGLTSLEVALNTGVSVTTARHHLRILREMGIVRRETKHLTKTAHTRLFFMVAGADLGPLCLR